MALPSSSTLSVPRMSYRLSDEQRRSAPPGLECIEQELLDIERRMRAAESAESSQRTKATWAIMRLHRERSRLVFDAFWTQHRISRRLYDWCVSPVGGALADRELVAKWRRSGYERLCCLRCIQGAETHTGKVCVCRVPRESLAEGQSVECAYCGCSGCS